MPRDEHKSRGSFVLSRRTKEPSNFREPASIDGQTEILYEWLSTRVRLSHPEAGVLLPPGPLPWLGGSSILELEVLGEGGQHGERHPQAPGDPAHVAPGRIDAPGLQVGDPGRVDVGEQP